MPETRELPEVINLLGDEIERALERLDAPAPVSPRAARPKQSQDGFSGSGRGSAWRMRRWPILAATVACAAAAIVAVALVAGIGSRGDSVGLQEALAGVAHKIELAPQPRPEQFVYTKSRTLGTSVTEKGLDLLARPNDQFVSSRYNHGISWISITRTGRMSWYSDPPTYPTIEDAKTGRRYWMAFLRFEQLTRRKHGRGELREIMRKIAAHNRKSGLNGIMMPAGSEVQRGIFKPNGSVYLGGEMVSAKELKTYPRDPKLIYDRVRADAEKTHAGMVARQRKHPTAMAVPDVDSNVWQTLTNPTGVQDQPVPADIRAVMVRALGLLPGVTALGDRTDALGRIGPAFALDHSGLHEQVIFDRDTSALLSATTTITDPATVPTRAFRHLPTGYVIYDYRLIEQKTVDRLPRRWR